METTSEGRSTAAQFGTPPLLQNLKSRLTSTAQIQKLLLADFGSSLEREWLCMELLSEVRPQKELSVISGSRAC